MSALPEYLTIEQTAELMSSLGIKTSVPTLREWRRTWPDGERRGPKPLLLSPRRLRYSKASVRTVVTEMVETADRAANAPPGPQRAPAG